MNQEQLKDAVRHAVTFFGGAFAGWAASRGWLTQDQIMAVLNSDTFIGLVVAAITAGWGFISRSKKNIVASAAAVPEVQAIVTASTTAGRDLANTVPASEVVPAGTAQAESLAKA